MIPWQKYIVLVQHLLSPMLHKQFGGTPATLHHFCKYLFHSCIILLHVRFFKWTIEFLSFFWFDCRKSFLSQFFSRPLRHWHEQIKRESEFWTFFVMHFSADYGLQWVYNFNHSPDFICKKSSCHINWTVTRLSEKSGKCASSMNLRFSLSNPPPQPQAPKIWKSTKNSAKLKGTPQSRPRPVPGASF